MISSLKKKVKFERESKQRVKGSFDQIKIFGLYVLMLCLWINKNKHIKLW